MAYDDAPGYAGRGCKVYWHSLRCRLPRGRPELPPFVADKAFRASPPRMAPTCKRRRRVGTSADSGFLARVRLSRRSASRRRYWNSCNINRIFRFLPVSHSLFRVGCVATKAGLPRLMNSAPQQWKRTAGRMRRDDADSESW